ncbi:MAG TPA: 30S ribosomal protein S16 [Candidatus Fimivivens sp.]|nr:30S ribosomal protein S16 [Candidatus Fimivivens sp.]
MLTIRFNRTGKKNRASFRIALQEKTKAPNHRHVEVLGSYDPHSKAAVLKKDRILHWLGMGAQASDSVHNLLVKEGVVEGKKAAIKMARPVKKEEPVEAPVAEAKPEVEATETVEEKAPEAAAE